MRYGTSYMGHHTVEAIKPELEDIRKSGFDSIILAAQENDFMHYTGRIDFTPKIAHANGLEVLVNLWGFAEAFGGGRMSRLVSDHPEVMVVDRQGKPNPLNWHGIIQPGCPNHPKVVGRAREYVDRAIEAGVDGFFWDEPQKYDCYCDACRELFRNRGGGDLAAAPEPERNAFRRWAVGNWIEGMSRYVKSKDRKLITSTCVMPSERDAWADSAACPSLDSLGTDTYWLLEGLPLEWMVEPCRALVDCARKAGKSPHLWLQCWSVPRRRERELVDASRILAEAEPDALYIWAYRGQDGTSETCDDPARAWECALEGFRNAGMKPRTG